MEEAQDETLQTRELWAHESPEEEGTLRTLEDFLAEADAETQQAERAPVEAPEPLEEQPSEPRGEGKRPPPLRELVGTSKDLRQLPLRKWMQKPSSALSL